MRIALDPADPDEYDAAARRALAACPLARLGDSRSGRQLLADAAGDASRTVAQLAETAAGRAELDGLAAYVEAMAAAVHASAVPEVRRCISDSAAGAGGGSSQATVPALFAARLGIERPLWVVPWALTFDSESSLFSAMAASGRAAGPIRRLWTWGSRPERILALVAALPPHMLALAERLMRAAHGLADAAQRPQAAFALPLPPSNLNAVSAAPAGAGRWAVGAEEAALWEQAEVGLVRVDYDPATQRRLGVSANSAAAKLWGLHREELLARFAAHDVPAMFTDLDAMHNFAADMSAPLESDRVLYVRMCFGGREAERGLLVAFGKDMQFNSLGQLCQVHALCACAIP